MARNRRTQSAAIWFGPTVKALAFCLFFGGSGVGYVWQKNQVYELSRQRKGSEVRLEAAQERTHQYEALLAALSSPQQLDARVRQLNLGLGPAQPEQVLRLVEAPASSRPGASVRQLAQSSIGSGVVP